MKRTLEYIWPVFGLCAVVVSLWILATEFKGESVAAGVWHQLASVSLANYLLAAVSALVAYAALAWYDRIALLHLGVTHISLRFIAACSFTTYALSHTIGASVFSGAMVRYRAYSSKGLSAAQVGILVAICSFTFMLGVVLLGGIVLVFEPHELGRIAGFLPHVVTDAATSRVVGIGCLLFVLAYVAASILRLRPLVVGGLRIVYPKPGIVARQLTASTLELLGACGIIFFALPEAGNPGFFVVLAVFLGSFSAALASNAPAGAGVFDLIFINALPSIPKAKVLAAVLLFRLFYLLIPLAFALLIVVRFERRRLDQVMHREPMVPVRRPGQVPQETA
jgi:glycosyltransferase 2 family protein